MLIDRDSRTVEGRCDSTAVAAGELHPGRPLVAAGAASPPPLEAAWLEIVGCVTLRRSHGDAGDTGVFPMNQQEG